MMNDVFNKMLASYRQRTLQTLDKSMGDASAPDSDQLTQLRQHIREWQQHYAQQEEALSALRDYYQLLDETKGLLTERYRSRLQMQEEEACATLMAQYQVKRDRIWTRHQQELGIHTRPF